MSNFRKLEFYLLRYMPSALQDAGIAIGVLGIEPEHGQFVDAKFLSNWAKVSALDPYADIEFLESLTREIQVLWCDPKNRSTLFQVMQDWSNTIQLSSKNSCITEEPAKELEMIVSRYL